MLTRFTPIAFAITVSLGACTEWGFKMPTGQEHYAAVSEEHVDVLFGPPPRAFKQIGIVSAMGGAFSSDVAMYKKLRKAAADLGADAVIATGQSQGLMTAPGSQTTIGSANTVGTVTPMGSYGSTVNANTTSTATTVGMPAMTFSYPKNQGIAIKYLQ